MMGSVEAIRTQPGMVKTWSSQQPQKLGGHGNMMLEAKSQVVGSNPSRHIKENVMLVADKLNILEATQLTEDSWEYDDSYDSMVRVDAGSWRLKVRHRFSSTEYYFTDEEFKKDYIQVEIIS